MLYFIVQNKEELDRCGDGSAADGLHDEVLHSPPDSRHQKTNNINNKQTELNYFRYIFGTDKLRPSAFEVRGMDGSSTGVIHHEEPSLLTQVRNDDLA